MSWVYGGRSRHCLLTCSPPLVAVAERGLELSPYDISIIHGWRGKEHQNRLVAEKKSRTPWPFSSHNNQRNGVPNSNAFDFAPYVGGIRWKDTHVFAVVAGCFFAASIELGIPIRWGGDWDSDGKTDDQTLMDWGHIELVPPA